MSKRAGEFITPLMVDEVGRDPVRVSMMLYRKNDAPLDFDFAAVTEQSKGQSGLLRAVCSASLPSGFPSGSRSTLGWPISTGPAWLAPAAYR